MENYTITKEQILELAKSSIVIKEKLNEMFPKAFKEEMEVGTWYKGTTDNNFLICYQGNGSDNYGFWQDQTYRNNISFGDYWVDECREATAEEIESALINKAKKKGYKKGVKSKCLISDRDAILSSVPYYSGDRILAHTKDLVSEFMILFKDGKWAEIIPEETKVVTIEKAIKILSKKYGKQVDIK